MMNLKNWAHTYLDMAVVTEYRRNAINETLFEFKPGTSIIENPKTGSSDAISMQNIQKNSIYVGYELALVSLNYERMFPLTDKRGITARVGIVMDFPDQFYFLGGTSLLLGGSKHFVEPGIMVLIRSDAGLVKGIFQVSYRYQSPKGFILKVPLSFGSAFGVFPGLSLGYSL